jgi:hypothetical protein
MMQLSKPVRILHVNDKMHSRRFTGNRERFGSIAIVTNLNTRKNFAQLVSDFRGARWSRMERVTASRDTHYVNRKERWDTVDLKSSVLIKSACGRIPGYHDLDAGGTCQESRR